MRLIIVCCTCLLYSVPLYSQSFNYTFGEINLNEYKVDLATGEIDANGIEVGISFALNQNFHTFGSFTKANGENGNIELEDWELGLGYNSTLSDNIDLIVSGTLLKRQLEVDAHGPVDYEGFKLGTGVRIWMTDRIELHAGVDFIEIEGAAEDTAFNTGLAFSLTDSIVLTFSGDWSDDPDTSIISLGARWYFNI